MSYPLMCLLPDNTITCGVVSVGLPGQDWLTAPLSCLRWPEASSQVQIVLVWENLHVSAGICSICHKTVIL